MQEEVLSLAYLVLDAEEPEGFFGDLEAYSSLSVLACASTVSIAC